MKQTVLLVEDEFYIRDPIKQKFIQEGYEVLEAANGEEGLKIALEKHPDLILSDINMPLMDGMAMLKKIRNDTWGKTVKAIILTGNDLDFHRIGQIMETSTTYYLQKPTTGLNEILEKSKDILNHVPMILEVEDPVADIKTVQVSPFNHFLGLFIPTLSNKIRGKIRIS